jgi:hypothetical protein
MAWRIHEHVVRGEIDNRVKGRVRGQVWLAGRVEPLRLDLTGNACEDLAGCLLRFANRGTSVPFTEGDGPLPMQEGSIGDLTASRKVRVFDIPIDEALEALRRGDKPPEHMANCLYLEWFSHSNGRVVIESTEFDLEISPPEWRLTAADNEQRARESSAGFGGFIQKLSDAVDAAKDHVDYDKENWDEFDYERFLRESDARTTKYMELLEKYGDDENLHEIIEREMGWLDDTEAESDDAEVMEEFADEATTALNEDPDSFAPDPATEGHDWIRTNDGDIRHPLQHRCYEGAMSLWRELDELNLPERESVDKLRIEYQILAAKLAGALNDLAYGRNLYEPGFVVAYLKRALSHLHAAQEALSRSELTNTLPRPIVDRVRTELFTIRESILELMDRFRGEISG